MIPIPASFKLKIRHFIKLRNYTFSRLVLCPLAGLNRQLAISTTVVGITGSAGKTTTKDLCASMLFEFGSCGKTEKSKNEGFQIVKTLLRIRPSHRYFIIEMSGSPPGTLDRGMKLARPTIGVLTNIGRDHYRAFGGADNVAREKAKIVELLPKGGMAVLNIDDPKVREIGESSPLRKVWVGRSREATIRLIEVSSKWPEPLKLVVSYSDTQFEIVTKLHGEHLALSVLCALGVAVALDLPLTEAIRGIEKVEAAQGRMQIIEGDDGITFVRDDWKAPEWTLDAAFKFLKDARAQRRIAVIGTLSDFSADNSAKYKQVGRRVAEEFDLGVFIGPNAHRALRARKHSDDQSLMGFERIIDAAQFLKNELRSGDVVLLKGSTKADHLARLVFDRSRPINCWEDGCGREGFCSSCPKLYDLQSGSFTRREADLKAISRVNEIGKSDVESKFKRVIVGLGNPGAQYDNTPHNVGYLVVEQLAEKIGAIWRECPQGLESHGVLPSKQPVVLFKPATKMNLSGEAVSKFLLAQNCHSSNCVIVHDEMDLMIGDVRVKSDGGSAGHKGVKSVLFSLGTHSVTRVRVGVRTTDDRQKAKDLILSESPLDERCRLQESVGKAVDLIIELNVKAN